jgi:hypothetical protein
MTISAASYTVVVPTFNRPQFLDRLLRYFARTRLMAPILIADGSRNDALRANQALIAQAQKEGMSVGHYIPPADPDIVSAGTCRFGYIPRLDLAMSQITTPFVHLLCDDCFASPEFFAAAAGILESDRSTSTVIGQMWTLTLDRTRTTTSTYGSIKELHLAASGGTRPGKSGLARLIGNNAGVGPMNVLWAMHRREHLVLFLRAGSAATRAVVENARYFDTPDAAEEWALDYWHGSMINVFALVNGNVRHVPHLMLGHQHHADNWGLQLSRGPRLNEAIMRPYWAMMSRPYLDAAAGLLAEMDGLSLDDARSAVQYGMWRDMARRIGYIADLRLREINVDDGAVPERVGRTWLKQIPGARMTVRAVLAQFSKYQAAMRLRKERPLMDAPEIRLLCEFIENDPGHAMQGAVQ